MKNKKDEKDDFYDDFDDEPIKYIDPMIQMDEEMLREMTRVFTKEDCPNMTQLEIDAVNVFENRVDINNFPKDYQQKIKNFYRFSPIDMKSLSASASGASRSFWK